MIAIERLKSDEQFWTLIDQVGLVSPMAGGCLVFAKALQLQQGGELVRIVSDAAGGQTEHYGLRLGTEIWDAEGAHRTPSEWIATFKHNEFVNDRNLSFATGFDDAGTIPDDPGASKAIASLMTEFVGPDQSEDDYDHPSPTT